MIGDSFDSHLNCSHHLLLFAIGDPYTANTTQVRSIKIMEAILRIYNTYTSFVSLGNHCLDLLHPILFSPQSQSFSTDSKNLDTIYAINAKHNYCLMIWVVFYIRFCNESIVFMCTKRWRTSGFHTINMEFNRLYVMFIQTKPNIKYIL